MAISESIRTALDDVFDAHCEVDALVKSFQAIEGEGAFNPIVYTMQRQFERYTNKCEALEKIIRQQALPLLEDFDATRARPK